MNEWSKQFNIEYPQCNKCGTCCKCASPSSHIEELKEKALKGDSVAQDFLDIFIPYETIEEAKAVDSSIVERSMKICENPENKINIDNLTFYRCKYLADDDSCQIYEDRPSICRNYPDSPFLVFSNSCAYKDWAEKCRKEYNKLQNDLKEAKQQMEGLKVEKRALEKIELANRIDNSDFDFCVFVPQMCLFSPSGFWIK